MKLNQFCFFVLLFIVCQSTNAQIPFVAKSFSSNTVKFEKASDVCELPSGKFVFVGEKTHPDSTYFVFVTDKYGNVLSSKYLLKPATNKIDTLPILTLNVRWPCARAVGHVVSFFSAFA